MMRMRIAVPTVTSGLPQTIEDVVIDARGYKT